MLRLIFKDWRSLMSVELWKYSVAAGCLLWKLLVFFTAILITVNVLPPGFSSHKNLGTCTNTVQFLLSLVEYHSKHKTSGTKEGGAHESSKQASHKRTRQSNWLRMYLHAAKWDPVTGSLFFAFSFLYFLYGEENCQLCWWPWTWNR